MSIGVPFWLAALITAAAFGAVAGLAKLVVALYRAAQYRK